MSLRKTFEDAAVSSVDEILEDVLPLDQRDLEHQIANSTGESLSEIRHHGFSLLTSLPTDPDPEDLALDWDAVEMARNDGWPSLMENAI